MLTTKKRGRHAFAIVAVAGVLLTACGPPGPRALHRGDRLVVAGKFQDAVPELVNATKLLTNQTRTVQAAAFNLLGLAFQGTKDAQQARQCYQQAYTLDRNMVAADFNMGCLELEQGNYTNLLAARDALTTYTSLRRVDQDGYLKLGVVYDRLWAMTPNAADKIRLLAAAQKAYESSLRVSQNAEALNNLGMIELEKKAPPTAASVSNAIAKFKAALSHNAQYAPAILNLAVVYDRYGDPHEALREYTNYTLLEPSPPHAAEVRVIMTNLDRALRIRFERPGMESEPVPIVSAPPQKGITIIRGGQSNSQPKPASADTNAPAPTPVPVPSENAGGNTTPSEPATTPITKPQSTPAPESGAATSPATTTEKPATTTENANASKEPPLTSQNVPQPSVLAKINPLNWFGGKPKAAGDGSEATTAPAPENSLTPMPPEHPTTHYIPPSVMSHPGDAAASAKYYQDGVNAEKQSRLKDAMQDYQDAIKADPANYEACIALGMSSIRAGEYTAALEALHHALTLKPDSADARYGYAWTLDKKNYHQDAANELEKLIAQHPNEVRAHLLLGNLYARELGQPDLAREHYKKVLEIEPKNAEAPKIQEWLEANK